MVFCHEAAACWLDGVRRRAPLRLGHVLREASKARAAVAAVSQALGRASDRCGESFFAQYTHSDLEPDPTDLSTERHTDTMILRLRHAVNLGYLGVQPSAARRQRLRAALEHGFDE